MDGVETYLALSDRERRWGSGGVETADAAVRRAGVRSGARVIDLGSGQGWHARRLAVEFDVLAVEQEPRLAAESMRRSRLRPEPEPLVLVAATADVPVPDSTVDMAMSVGSSIGYGPADDDRGMLEEVRRLLRPGGRAVIEAVSADGAAALEQRVVRFPDGASARYRPRFDGATQTLSEHQVLTIPDGRRGWFGYGLHAYDPGDLLDLARGAGLEEDGVFGSLRGGRWAPPAPVVVVLRRPEPACSVRFDVG